MAPRGTPTPIPAFVPTDSPEDIEVGAANPVVDDVDIEIELEVDVVLGGRSELLQLIWIRGA